MNARPRKYRSQIRILADIVEAVSKGKGEAKSTHILYSANLSHDRLVRYLDELKERQLIEEKNNPDGTTYALTDKGVDFLKEFKKITSFAEAFGFPM